ncbi:MAG: SAM-dependent methyltransferase [Clostridia bacterium]|nr:SAM-dependent methyltransferase [Clostridia bacterium]
MKQPIVLDDRLSRAAALFPACAYGADIGADHGRLSCYLLLNGICERMCVADISAPSLQKAMELITGQGLDARADFRVGDGLSVLPQRADAVAILGMGGHTLCGILTAGAENLQGASLILSAHTDVQLLRKTLMELAYRIDREEIAFAAGRFYVVLRAVPGHESMGERELLLGPRLMESVPEHYKEYLAWRMAIASKKRTEEGRREWTWLKEEYSRVCNCWMD